MAIGLSYLFNIHLPINFYSPYKACNIIEFWRRWHMTLSRFLRDYLYFPLGGNRKGPLRRYVNLMLTMLLGGFWHGAGWNFILWGALHGTYLIVNHGWQVLRRSLGYDPRSSTVVGRLSATLLTFLAVVVAWVFFRAKTLSGAQLILKGMIGLNGIVLPAGWLGGLTVRLADFGVHAGDLPLFAGALQLLWIVLALLACWLLPNTAQFMVLTAPPHGSEALPSPGGGTALRWRPTWVFACYCAVLATCGLLGLNRVTEFLYFNF